MDPNLRNRLIALGASGASAIAIAVALALPHEGRVYRPYYDPVGILTVCAGITGPDVVVGKTYTPSECDALEAKHMKIAEAGARRQIQTWDELNRWQQAALIDYTYNAGEANLAGSTMKRRFNAHDFVGGCMELAKWVKGRVKGQLVTLNGLVKRRADEQDLCLNWKS